MLRVVIISLIVILGSQCIASGGFSIIPRRTTFVIYNFLVAICMYSLLNIIFWDYDLNGLIVIVLTFLLSIAMYYVHEFRGTNFNFSDLLSINTAGEVAGGYKYEVKPIFVICFLGILVEAFLVLKRIKNEPFRYYNMPLNNISTENTYMYRLLMHELSQLIIFLISFNIIRDIVSKKKFDYSLNAGENEGYLYNFISSIPIFHKSNNKKLYYDDNTRGIISEMKESIVKYKENGIKCDTKNPHVIVIMNESFGSIQDRLDALKPITPYYDSLSSVVKGKLYVNTFGGGTANTEFEFLTGMTIGNYPYPVMPYNNFVKRNKYSLARYFHNQGYKTISAHPYTATNYHRDRVYKYFGFDEILFFKDFSQKKYLRKFVDDESMYQEVIRRYESCKNANEKLFLFGITMQNHSGYESCDEYMDLMRTSDRAIKLLIEYFKKENERVVILFFGDHNASFGTDLNRRFFDCPFNYEFSNAYYTPFFIFDNKNNVDKYIEVTSANFLSLELIKTAGLPMDKFHNFLNDIYNEYCAFNYHKCLNRNNKIISNIDIDSLKLIEKIYLR